VEFVSAFLADLDEPQAAVFHLVEIEGMSAPEVAAALGVKLNTVYARLRLARKRFERLLRRKKAGDLP
jgi:RNA polymerase sigma-70 factor (ECF subfamily)